MMESFGNIIFVFGLVVIFVSTAYYVVFRFSPVRSVPSLKTLPIWAIVGILLSTMLLLFSNLLLLKFDSEIKQILPYGNTSNSFLITSGIVLLLWLCWITFVFWFEKRRWVHRNPNYSRLTLQAINKFSKIEGVSIRSVDGIMNGRGVCFSWFNGYLIVAGKHKFEFEFYKYFKFKRFFPSSIIYHKTITVDVAPGINYTIEAQPDSRNFRVSRTIEKEH